MERSQHSLSEGYYCSIFLDIVKKTGHGVAALVVLTIHVDTSMVGRQQWNTHDQNTNYKFILHKRADKK
jgi:hypothetical protein